MLNSKDNNGKTIGWRETYFSKDESVDVSVPSARLRPETGRRARSIRKHLSARRRSRQMGRSEKPGCGAFWAVLWR
jgi:hypothetical protein